MTRIWFVVPVHGREALTRVCLRQLRRTCDALPFYATAVVIGEGESLDVAHELGFATVARDNTALGRKFNDGFELATNPEVNPHPADYVVPCGSDDWIDPVIFRRLPGPNTVGVFRQIGVVNEDRTILARKVCTYKTAAGPKIIPRELIAAAGSRPAEEDRRRAIDASTIEGIKRAIGHWPRMLDLDVHPLQIIDWKSHTDQLNSFRMLAGHKPRDVSEDIWADLAEHYPAEAVEEMQALRPMAVAA